MVGLPAACTAFTNSSCIPVSSSVAESCPFAIRWSVALRVPLALADNDNGRIGAGGRFPGPGNLVNPAAGDVAALDIAHLRARRDDLLDPFQDRDDVLGDGRGSVVAKLVAGVVGIRADHSDRTQRFAEWKQLCSRS